VTAKQQKIETTALSPNQIVRLKDGKKFLVMAPRSSPKKLKLATFLSQCGLVTVPVAGSAPRLSNGSNG